MDFYQKDFLIVAAFWAVAIIALCLGDVGDDPQGQAMFSLFLMAVAGLATAVGILAALIKWLF